MFFQKKNRRKIERYPVSWDAALEIRYPDYDTRIAVTITDFSGKGALIRADRVHVNNRLLTSTHHRPRLSLKTFSPQGLFQAEVNIRWYRWDVDSNGFIIGLEYVDPSPENQLLAARMLNLLHQQCQRQQGLFQRVYQQT